MEKTKFFATSLDKKVAQMKAERNLINVIVAIWASNTEEDYDFYFRAMEAVAEANGCPCTDPVEFEKLINNEGAGMTVIADAFKLCFDTSNILL